MDTTKIRHGLFIAHLALEKMLKAHVCLELAPRIHNLVRLAEMAGLKLSETQIDLLADASEFNIEGRYSKMLIWKRGLHYCNSCLPLPLRPN